MKRHGKVMRVAVVQAAAAMMVGNLACSTLGIHSEEEYAHAVLAYEGRFEIRDYEPCIVATTIMVGEMDEVSGPSFNRLAGYIFGDNTARDDIAMTVPVMRSEADRGSERIAMTVPVTREATDDGWTMSFVMPSEYTMETLPEPVEDDLDIESRPGVLRAVYRYSGVQRAADLEEYAPKLIEWAEAQGYRPIGDATLAAYDPPWTLWFVRRTEVMIEVVPGGDASSGSGPASLVTESERSQPRRRCGIRKNPRGTEHLTESAGATR